MNTVDQATATQLRQFIEKIERLEEEKTALAQDVREIFAEAKSRGFEPKTMRQVLKIRKMDTDERSEQEHLLDTYLAALDLSSPTSHGQAA